MQMCRFQKQSKALEENILPFNELLSALLGLEEKKISCDVPTTKEMLADKGTSPGVKKDD